jgi:predicted lactoylglutathione lyase
MTKQFWLNLPVKNINRSKDFFTNLGFSFKEGPGNTDTSAALSVGGIVVMLFEEDFFKTCTGNELTDTKQGTEVLMSVDAESREEVDELARKAAAAGGIVFGQPGEHQGWMYSCGFTDPDGHRWNVLHMDMSKMQQ